MKKFLLTGSPVLSFHENRTCYGVNMAATVFATPWAAASRTLGERDIVTQNFLLSFLLKKLGNHIRWREYKKNYLLFICLSISQPLL